MKALEWSQRFSNCKYISIFPDGQGQLTPLSEVRSGRNSNSSQLLMVVLVTEDLIKIEDTIVPRVLTRLYVDFSLKGS